MNFYLNKLIKSIINIKTENNESFSAYDITKAARLTTSFIINHSEVRDLVHEHMLDYFYYDQIDKGYILYQPKNNSKKYVPQPIVSVDVQSRGRITIKKDILDKVFGNHNILYYNGKILTETKCSNGKSFQREDGKIRIPTNLCHGDKVDLIIHSNYIELI